MKPPDGPRIPPVSWTKALDEADALAESLAAGPSADHYERVQELLEVIRLSGKMTPWLDRRRRLAAALSYWSSVLALESDRIVRTPVLAEAVDDELDPSTEPLDMDSPDAVELLRREVPIDAAKIFHLNLGHLPDIRKIELTKSRLIRGEFDDLLRVIELNLDMTTLIDFNFKGPKISRELKASHAQFFGGDLMFQVRNSDFSNAVARYCRFAHTHFGSTTFENAELSPNPEPGVDSTQKQEGVRRWISELGLPARGAVQFTSCTFGDNVSFQLAVLVDVIFVDCRMRGADFSGAMLADVSGPRLLRASFVDCDLKGANFKNAINAEAVEFDEKSRRGALLPAMA